MQNEELRRAKVELEAQRARYFDLYYSAPASYCTVSEKGLILQANIAATILLGISYNASIKRPILQFISSEDQDNYYLLCQQILRSRKPLGCELQMVKNDGTPFWVNLMATMHYVDNSQEFRIVLIDITERKQMQEELRKSEEKFYAIADYTVDFELWFAAYGKLLWVNSAAERITGYSPTEILALPDFFRPRSVDCKLSGCFAWSTGQQHGAPVYP
jgi:PAS domain S-box-containing protein